MSKEYDNELLNVLKSLNDCLKLITEYYKQNQIPRKLSDVPFKERRLMADLALAQIEKDMKRKNIVESQKEKENE